MNSSNSPPVDADDRPFRHYTLKHRAIAWVSLNLFDSVTYTVHHGLIAGMKRKGGLGWIPIRPKVTAEQRFWEQLDLYNQVIYDVGAFEGVLTLFFASRGKRVISYEPVSRNYQRLVENLQLNQVTNVTVRKVGLGSRRGSAILSHWPLMPGGASMDPKTVEGLQRVPQAVEEIPLTTLDEDIREHGLPEPNFIKIDVEGMEGEALGGAQRTLAAKPALFIEMHGETMNEKRRKCAEVIELLEQAGYRDIFHLESNTRVTSQNTAVAVEGHLYCPSQASTSKLAAGASA